MLTQLASLGRASRGVSTRSKQVGRNLHTDVAAAAKSSNAGTSGAKAVAVKNVTFSELLASQIEAYPHKDTYESAVEDLKWTTQQLNAQVYSVTGGLHSMAGNGRQAYTAQAVLRAETLAGLLASPRAGKLFALVPPFRTAEMISDLKKSSAQFLLFFPKVGKTAQIDEIYKVFPNAEQVSPVQVIHMCDKRIPNFYGVIHTAKRHFPGMTHHLDFLAPNYYEELIRPGTSIASEEVSTLILDVASGKFAAFSQSNLINTATSVSSAIGLTSDAATLGCISPATAQGLTVGMMTPLVSRSKLVVPFDEAAADIPRIHDSIAKHGASHIVGDAGVFRAILSSSQPAQTKSFGEKIKSATLVGDHTPVDPELIKAIKTTLGVATVHITNGSIASTGVALVDGQAIPNSQVKLVDQAGKDTTSSGFVAVKGVNVFKGFYDEGKLDASSIKADWVVTNVKAQQTSPDTYSVIN